MKRALTVAFLFLLMMLIAACGSEMNGSERNNSDADTGGENVLADYPNDQITIVWSSSPGSGGDIFLRELAKPLEEELGVPIIVENREGASGANAWNYILNNTKPDGHTLLGISATFISSPIINDLDISYKDFKPVAQLVNEPQFVYTYANTEFKDISDVIAYEKEHPQQLKWATATPGSKDNIPFELLFQEAQIQPHTISFESGTDAMTQIVGGHIDIGLGEYSSLKGQIESGTVKILGVMTKERYEQLPDVPTLTELGWDVAPILPRGIVVHGDTPDEIADFLAQKLEKVLDDEAFQELQRSQGLERNFAARDEFRQNLEELDEFFRSLLSK